MSIHVAIIGATGLVGSLVLDVLAERAFPVKSIKLLASARSVGRQLSFRAENMLLNWQSPPPLRASI